MNLVERIGRYIWGASWQAAMASYLQCRVDHIQDCRQGRRRLHPEQWKQLQAVVKAKADAASQLVQDISNEVMRAK
jgi:hypothetical protein